MSCFLDIKKRFKYVHLFLLNGIHNVTIFCLSRLNMGNNCVDVLYFMNLKMMHPFESVFISVFFIFLQSHLNICQFHYICHKTYSMLFILKKHYRFFYTA